MAGPLRVAAGTAPDPAAEDSAAVAGLGKLDSGTAPHRPLKVIHAIAYREDHEKPTFVADISDEFETKPIVYSRLIAKIRRLLAA